MFLRSLRLVLLVAVALSAGAFFVNAQSADVRDTLNNKRSDDDNDRPRSFKETLEKLRIEKEKKEYDQMLERGEEALRISENLERAYTINGRLTEREMSQLATVEKLVKKIRSGLGGDDDEDDNDKPRVNQPMPPEEAVKSFRTTTLRLFDELKKTSRFTISTAAIQTSNAVLKLARFLRIAK